MALLGRGDEQRLVAEPADGNGLAGQHQLGVAVPADGELRGAQEGAGEDDRAADAGLQVLWCQGHVKGVWVGPGETGRKSKAKGLTVSGVWLGVGGDRKRPWESGDPGSVSKMSCVCVCVCVCVGRGVGGNQAEWFPL